MVEYCTYIIRCNDSKKNYYGSTTNFKKRVKDHKYLLYRNKHHSSHLQNAWNKYGEDAFEFIVLKIFHNKDSMLSAEKALLINFKTNSYNVSTEVDKCHMLGRHHTEATKEKLRNMFLNRIVSEETKEKLRIARAKQIMVKGRKHTPEAIEKIKAARAKQIMVKGRKHTPEAKEKMRLAKLGKKFPRKNNENF